MTSDYWDRRALAWGQRMKHHEGQPDLYGSATISALAPRPGERVLDIGCGRGGTSLQLAELVVPDGYVVGLDISPAMISAATTQLAGRDLPVEFRVGDAAVEDLGGSAPEFDAVFSRFGVMFFGDPAAAFVNIASGVRRGGRLAWVVWGPLEENPWATVPTMAAARVLGTQASWVSPGVPGPFALGDQSDLEELLIRSGFDDVTFRPLSDPRVFQPETELDELGMWLTIGPTGEAYSEANPELQREAAEAALEAIGEYRTPADNSIQLPALARVVTAQRV